jgi:sugar phosphate isomerase/epimerase
MVRAAPTAPDPLPPMKLKLSCADFTFPLLSHENALDVIAMLEIEGVDIGLFEGRSHLRPGPELAEVGKRAKGLAKNLRHSGLKLADVFLIPGANFAEMAANHPDKRVHAMARAQFQRAIEYAVVAGGRHFSALPGVFWDTMSKADSIARSIEELSWRVAYAKDQGIVYSVEPHVGSIIPTPKAAARLVEAVPGLTLTLDYTHFTRIGIPDREIEPLVKYATHFHCRGARKGRLQASFKDNTIDYARVVKTMRQENYPGYVGIEYVWQDWEHCNESDNLSETVLFRDFLRRLK